MDAEDKPPPSPPPQEPNINSSTSTAQDEYAARTDKSRGKFRFKSSSKSKHSSSRSSRHDSYHHRHSHRHHDRSEDHDKTSSRDHHRHKRRKPAPPRSPSPNTVPSYPGGNLSPNTAFRESLFDALGDDEGAAFWEGVYGQPIHSFFAPPGQDSNGNGERRGELDHLDEEEYAAYVRSEMWKRTREGMLEEQERLRAEKRAKIQAEKASGEGEERRRFESAMEDSLRRGRERKKEREAWKGVWGTYLGSWEEVEAARRERGGSDPGAGEGKKVRNLLFWPVLSGKRREVSRENVEEFMRRAPPKSASASAGDAEDLLLSTLKAERVRWHPDKIQHRYGALGLDDSVMRSVTEVFQIIDHMWNELKK
ncbi:hypothetical protein BJX70DRAFT_396434 [Aspergillus crustosus]